MVIPVPILRECRRSQRETGEVKAHPTAAMFHVMSKGLALGRHIGTRIEKDNNAVAGKKIAIQLVPVVCRLEGKSMFRGHIGEPVLGFVDKTGVCRFNLAVVERNHAESRRGRLAPATATTIAAKKTMATNVRMGLMKKLIVSPRRAICRRRFLCQRPRGSVAQDRGVGLVLKQVGPMAHEDVNVARPSADWSI